MNGGCDVDVDGGRAGAAVVCTRGTAGDEGASLALAAARRYHQHCQRRVQHIPHHQRMTLVTQLRWLQFLADELHHHPGPLSRRRQPKKTSSHQKVTNGRRC